MYRPAAYAIDDVAVLHETMRRRSFATLAGLVRGRVQFAYAPVVVDADPAPLGSVRFHLARANPLAGLDGGELRLSFLCSDAYVSPDWYATAGYVPTWNYIAVEAAGHARLLDDAGLGRQVAELSAQQEEKLLPKPPWTAEKITGEKLTALLNGIRAFAVPLETLEGKFKLSQDKTPDNIAGVIASLEGRGDSASMAVAKAMKAAAGGCVRASKGSA